MNQLFTRIIVSILLMLGSGFISRTTAQQSGDSRILLQAFYWDCYQGNEGQWYNIVANKSDEIVASGFDMIWLPAPSASSGGMGYLPTELFSLNNSFGTEEEQRNLLSTLNSKGIEPIADIVINHRNGSTNWVDFTNPEWDGTKSIVSNDEVWSQPEYSNLPRGGNDTGESYAAGRDIDHTNNIVRQGIKDWLSFLKDAGYKGWRYDLVKGYSPNYTAEYNDASNPSFSVGEFYDFDKQKVQNWVDGTNNKSTAFDFPTYSTIKDAIKDNNYSYLAHEGKASGLIGWSPAQSTTFIENHDTPRYDTGRNILNSGNVCIGYAYILTHPGTPTIYWPHYFDWGVKDKINELITVRKNAGITNTSQLDIVKADANCYAAVINGNVAVKLGSGDWSPGTEYELKTSGNNYAVWSKAGTIQTPELSLTKGGNFSSGSVAISMQATNDATIYYTLDGTTPDENSTLYSAGFNLTTETTIKAVAINDDGLSDIMSETYTFNAQKVLKVMWKTNVSTPSLWFWDVVDEGDNPTYTWPGVTMEASANKPGWFEYTIQGSGASFIFSDAGSNQTADQVNITDTDSNPTDGIIWYDNGWVDGDKAETALTVMWKTSVSTPSLWFWDVVDAGDNPTYTWPGATMEASANNQGWFEYTIQGSGASLIFSDAGSNQTADQVNITDTDSNPTDGIIWYDNGWVDGNSSTVVNSSVMLSDNGILSGTNDEREVEENYFTWDNANVYFVMTDRFYNGDTSNDNSYGRGLDGDGNEYPDDSNSGAGEFHGGDLKGMTAKLKEGYFEEIGVNAIWITSPIEQMHGWCGGGPAGNFRHYAYHGYYALDWSELDDNMGTEADLLEFVDEAHSRGIRIVFDIVINHTGYATMHGMEEFNYGTVNKDWHSWMPSGDQTWHSYHDIFVNYEEGDWTTNYWGTDWIRHPDIAGYETGGGDLTLCVGFLPDVKTESTQAVDIPGILRAKWTASGILDQKLSELDVFFTETQLERTVSNYMIFWVVDWVREFGIDGFRIDTAKHVEKEVLKRLKDQAVKALRDWKEENPEKVMNEDDFWMTGEVWGHGFDKSPYHTEAGFNSIINFNLQSNELKRDNLEGTFSDYARVNDDRTWNGLSYLSSHDTELYDRSRLREVAPGFLLLPGGIQTFYGDETGRPLASYDDAEQNTRSDMNWGNFDEATFNVWKKLGTFRREHASVGAGTHTQLSSSPYIFARDYVDPVTGFEDNVIVSINANGPTEFDVSERFPNGHEIEDYYTGNKQAVVDGKVTFTADSEGIILLWDTDFVNVNKPIVNFITSTEWSEDPLEITLSITDKEDPNPVLYYTFNDALTTDNLDAWNVYTNPFVIDATQTIRIVGINKDANLSRVYSKTYSVGPIEPFTVHLYQPEGWAGAYVFFDELTPEGAGVSTVIAWPGAEMVPEGNGWYSYSIKAISAGVLVFNGGSNTQQTDDLSRSGDGWYKDGAWSDSCPGNCPGPQVPVVSLSINESSVEGTFNVSISATQEGVIYYTTDSSEPNESSNLYSTSFEVSLGTLVKAIAYNSEGPSTIVSETALEKETLTFMWKTTAANNPSIHIWNVDGVAGDLTVWPGATMTASSTYSGWFEYTIEGSSANVIFYGSNGQTDDLENITDNDGELDGIVWYNNEWVSKPGESTDSLIIHYKGDYTHIYYWDDNLNAPVAWPGTLMTNPDAEEWYTFVIPEVSCSNIIFNNTSSQTADLYRCGEGWYTNDIWYDTYPSETLTNRSSQSIQEISIRDSEFSIYPNPADDFINISNVANGSQINIYDALGRLVLTKKINHNQVNINKLSSGMYFIKIGSKTRKLYVK